MPRITPLHLQIALHYYMTPLPYARHDRDHANSPAVRRFTADLVRAGMIEPADTESGYAPTAGLHMWVEALKAVPVPHLAMQWTMDPPVVEGVHSSVSEIAAAVHREAVRDGVKGCAVPLACNYPACTCSVIGGDCRGGADHVVVEPAIAKKKTPPVLVFEYGTLVGRCNNPEGCSCSEPLYAHTCAHFTAIALDASQRLRWADEMRDGM